ncbi:MAG: hypothetical protein P0Y56_03675 [Candidatus Andeanibacterium colombiense]|uniref:Cell wall polymerase n=1 Tax=Candidatus Andeanibacterium colombiense TaxID=3121345 RepID=A0AAJ5X7R4_9SPHN|nr:MAG: hypothetical protein P0Y56_03675 [Sphingomonadaceae bacterium]
MTSGFTRRLTGFSGHALAILAGIGFMALEHAPSAYIAVNGMALVAALALLLLTPATAGQRHAGAIGIAALAVLGASLLGPDSDGVHRWIALGPLRLNSAMLALPALSIAAVLAQPRVGALLVAIAALVIAFQPDRAAALALLCGATPLLGRAPRWPGVAACLAAAIALTICWLRPDALAPVPFVEGVLQAAWIAHPVAGAAITAGLCAALLVPLRLAGSRPAALALGGTLVGFTLSSLFGAFPTPLAGYGASAILGYAAAFALLPLNGRAEVS